MCKTMISFRATEAEAELLAKRADQSGLSRSDVLRELVSSLDNLPELTVYIINSSTGEVSAVIEGRA